MSRASLTDQRILLNGLYVFVLLGMGYLWDSGSVSEAQTVSKKPEVALSFPDHLNASAMDFKLMSLGHKKFKVVLNEAATKDINVKIYDVLGNLILEAKIKPEDNKEKTFYFSSNTSQLFVVEVGNGKYNKTKSVYAQPQGKLTEE